LPMEEAVRNYDRYRHGEYAWMLGRFVVTKERADEVPMDFAKSVLGVDEVKAEKKEDLPERRADIPVCPDRQECLSSVPTFVEITDVGLIPELAKHGLAAKIRTGGLTAEAIPHADRVATF